MKIAKKLVEENKYSVKKYIYKANKKDLKESSNIIIENKDVLNVDYKNLKIDVVRSFIILC